MLGVGGYSFSLGMGPSDVTGFTENDGSKYDSLNFPFTLAALQKTRRGKTLEIKERLSFLSHLPLTCKTG